MRFSFNPISSILSKSRNATFSQSSNIDYLNERTPFCNFTFEVSYYVLSILFSMSYIFYFFFSYILFLGEEERMLLSVMLERDWGGGSLRRGVMRLKKGWVSWGTCWERMEWIEERVGLSSDYV